MEEKKLNDLIVRIFQTLIWKFPWIIYLYPM